MKVNATVGEIIQQARERNMAKPRYANAVAFRPLPSTTRQIIRIQSHFHCDRSEAIRLAIQIAEAAINDAQTVASDE